MREYSCCRSGAPQDLSHPLCYVRGVRKTFNIYSNHVAWRRLSTGITSLCVQAAQQSVVVVGMHMLSSHGQLQKSSSVPLSHLLVEELKQ